MHARGLWFRTLASDNGTDTSSVDDLTFTARRATATRPEAESDLDTRFRNLVQSPLRAGILRYLSARPEESFDSDQLMQTFGRLRQDVDNCVKELVSFGVARALPGVPARAMARRGRTTKGSKSCSTGSSSGGRPSALKTRRLPFSASAK